MNGVTFIETLRRHWRAMLYWGIGIALMGFFQVIIVPNADVLQQFSELYENLGPLIRAFGGEDLEFVGTPEGYLATQYFSIIVVIYAVYAVMGGLNVTANDEDSGITNILLSLPLPRWKLLLEKTLAYAVMLSGAVVIGFFGLWAGMLVTPTIQVDLGRTFLTMLNIIPSLLLILGVTVLAAALTRRKSLALTSAASFVVISYFIDALGRAATGSLAETVRIVSFMKYYDGPGVMQFGLAWGDILLLSVLAVAFIGLAMASFQRRDLA